MINSTVNSEVTLQIADMLGRKMNNQKIFLQEGLNSISLSDARLVEGNYFMRQADDASKGTTGYASIRAKDFLRFELPVPESR